MAGCSNNMIRKRALLVGIKHNNPTMISTHLDCSKVKDCIIKHRGFLESDVYTITDDKNTDPATTTAQAIINQLTTLAEITCAGDVLFFYFSGHGYISSDQWRPTFVVGGGEPITGLEFQACAKTLKRVKAVFTVIADCSHSGGFLTFTNEQIGRRVKMEQHGIMISSCRQDQVSLSTVELGSVFTLYLVEVIAEAKGIITYWDLVMKVKLKLIKGGTIQIPVLHCTEEEAKTQIF